MSYAYIDTSDITADGGRPKLYIDGVKTPPVIYALSDIPAAKAWKDCSKRAIRNFGRLGIHIVSVDTNLHEDWTEDGDYEPRALYRNIEAVLAANPDAKVITRLHLNPPYFWLRRYPDEQIRYITERKSDGITYYEEPEKTDSGTYGDRTVGRGLPFEVRASLASERWIVDVCHVLRILCEKVKRHPLGKALIGIQVAAGTAGEWHAYADSDYSEPMRRLYVEMAREKYKNVNNLCRFYGENADFETLQLPKPWDVAAVFSRSKNGILSPEKDARVADFLRAYSCASARAIRRFCACIREAWGGGLLTGAFYGYFFCLGGATAAHFETEAVLSDKNIDFLAAPCAYGDNKKSGHMNMLRYVAESCRLHGKLMFCEMDQGYRSVNRTAGVPYVCESEAEYSSLLKRNIMENILLGHGAWYYDHRLVPSDIYVKEEYWNTPERLRTIGEIQRVCEMLEGEPYVKTTDVLLVVDAESKYVSIGSFGNSFEVIDALGKSGVGFDRLYLTDLKKVNLSRYRCIIFAGCSVVSEDMYDYIRDKVISPTRTVVLMGVFAAVVGIRTNTSGAFSDDAAQGRVIVLPDAVTDPRVYRKIFSDAGARVYTDGGEVVVADRGLVMVHSRDVPESTFHLPAGDITVGNEPFETAVYRRQDGKRIL